MSLSNDDINREAKLAALKNAIKFKGKANQGAVVGALFQLDSTIKQRMKDVAPIIGKIVSDVNSMDYDSQKAELNKLEPDFEDAQKAIKAERKKNRFELPELRNAHEGKVVTRMPPGPSKYAHIGHAISFGINYLYSKMYKGKCILRFDDTNPEVEKAEFVDSIKEDVIDYMGFKPDEIVFASDYMNKYYELAEKLINDGLAYACDCPSENISKNRREMKDCSHRNMDKFETLKIWNELKSGKESNYTLRLKIDMKHKNAVMRDPVIFRQVLATHYRQKNKYKLWPMYDFESGLMDGLLGMTHVLRSNEFDSRIELHNYIQELFGYSKVEYKHYGRSNVVGSLTKGREIRAKIESGDFIGWDDPRLVTLKALKRRGITREAIVNVVKKAGLSKTNTNIDYSVISSENRKILDESAKRFFFISESELTEIKVNNLPEQNVELDLHPVHDKGGRKFKTNDSFYIQKKDYDKIISSKKISRLMDCVNVSYNASDNSLNFESIEYEKFKDNGELIIHWLVKDESQLMKTEIYMSDAKWIKGISELTINKLKIGDIIQFERFGFCRLDEIDKSNNIYKFWYTHE